MTTQKVKIFAAGFALLAASSHSMGFTKEENDNRILIQNDKISQIAFCYDLIDRSKAAIADENRAAKISGVVDQRVLHAAGKNIISCQDSIQADYSAYRNAGGKRPLLGMGYLFEVDYPEKIAARKIIATRRSAKEALDNKKRADEDAAYEEEMKQRDAQESAEEAQYQKDNAAKLAAFEAAENSTKKQREEELDRNRKILEQQ